MLWWHLNGESHTQNSLLTYINNSDVIKLASINCLTTSIPRLHIQNIYSCWGHNALCIQHILKIFIVFIPKKLRSIIDKIIVILHYRETESSSQRGVGDELTWTERIMLYQILCYFQLHHSWYLKVPKPSDLGQ